VLDTAPLLSAPGSRNDREGTVCPAIRPGASDSRLPLEKTRLIPVGDIESAGPQDGAGLRALFESILQWGLLQPLIVRPTAGGRYEVLVGRKRFAAARSAGFTEVPCVVFEGPDADAARAGVGDHCGAGRAASRPRPAPAPEGDGRRPAGTAHHPRATIDRLALEGAQPDGLRQRVARELLAAELQRASWIVDALLAFHGPSSRAAGRVRLGPLLRSALEPFQAECRLGGIDVRVMVEPADWRSRPARRPCAARSTASSARCWRACTAAAIPTRAGDPGLGMAGMGVLSLSQNVVPLQGLVRLRAGARAGGGPVGDALLASFAFEAARRTVEAAGRADRVADGSWRGWRVGGPEAAGRGAWRVA
jgi:hypothetical protein